MLVVNPLSCCLSPVSSLFLSYTRLRSMSNPNVANKGNVAFNFFVPQPPLGSPEVGSENFGEVLWVGKSLSVKAFGVGIPYQ